MEESDSSRNSSIFSNDSDERTSTSSSTEMDEELYLSSPTAVSPYRFEPLYNSDEEPGPSTIVSSSLLSETEEYSYFLCSKEYSC